MLRATLAFVLLSAVTTPSWAQAPKSIDPGMSEAKVVERLGQPDVSRTSGDLKYLFYHNNCIRQCGMDDVVILQKDSVVDALFRSADRSYTGKSSSPRSISSEVASRNRPRGPREEGPVVQAGAPKTDSAKMAPPAMPDSAKKSTADTAATAPAPAKHSTKKRAPKSQAVSTDSVRHDTVTGTLRIPVKPPNYSPRPADSTSTRNDSTAKRPPHQK